MKEAAEKTTAATTNATAIELEFNRPLPKCGLAAA